MEHLYEADIESKLHEKEYKSVLTWIKSKENDLWVKKNVWNLISRVCLTVKIKELLDDDSDVEACRSILLYLVNIGNPKEVIVALMEEADSFKSHPYFCLLLEPLKMALKHVPGKRGKSLEWVLSTLNSHIHLIPPPEDLDLQGDEKLLLDTDTAVVDTTYVLTSYLPFIDAFVEEVSFDNVKKSKDLFVERVINQRVILIKYLLILLCRPFLYHDLHVSSISRPKSTIRVLCERCFTSLSKICANVFKLFNYDCPANLQDEEEEDDTIPQLAFSTLSYLIFVEDIATHFQPFVYSHKYLFKTHLKYILMLLEKKENLVLFKGLHLAKVLLERLCDLEITYNLVELSDFSDLSKQLLNVAVFSQIKVHRKMALEIFLSYLTKCDWKGRYHLINQVLDTANHSGCEGVVINVYKTHLHDSLSGKIPPDIFTGKNLALFLKKVFVLKEGVETDILENIDKIITALNFLRYILLRDPKKINITGVWGLLPQISEKFLDPLLTAIDMSRAHYKQAAIDYEKGQKKDAINATVTVNNEVLPNVPPHYQKDMLDKALVAFDMIESVLSRVLELI